MSKPQIRRAAVIGLALVAAVGSAGCDLVKVGARCTTGSAPGRDRTHLVLCQNGRWTRSITLQETANILVGLLPAKIEIVGGSGQSTVVGSAFGKDFTVKVTRGDGRPSVGTEVDLVVPKSGASLDRGPRALKTGEDGTASFLATANTVAGSYQVTARVNGRDLSAPFEFTNVAATAKNVTVVSGANQSVVANTDVAQPIVLKVTDAYGNPVAGNVPTITSPDVMLAGQPSSGTFSTPVATGPDGQTSFKVKAPARSGPASFTAVASAAAASSGVTFALTVRPDVADRVDISVDAGTQSAPVSTAFGKPLAVSVFDQYDNPVPGLVVTYTVVPAGSAGATLSASTATTNSVGVASVVATANSTVGGPYDVQVSVAGFAPQSSLEFTLTNTA